MSIHKAFILAGGKGTRCRPLTYETPKALIPVHGKPIIQHQIELLRDYGVEEIILSIGYLGDQLLREFKDGSEHSVKISYVQEDMPLGTAGPLHLAKDRLTESFYMLNSDVLTDINLGEFSDFHRKLGVSASIALTPVDDPSSYGVVSLEGDKVLEFSEKHETQKKSNLINAGIYIIEPNVIGRVPEGKAMMERDVFPKLASEKKLAGYRGDFRWYDSGTLEKYERAEEKWGK
ncbi:MAG: NTP transferase domain-containing protein [Candidatus Altiarchaeales archaeon]|nr:NTP transferase domain-containing protein [Candidatus Altiarchaeales archaeon]